MSDENNLPASQPSSAESTHIIVPVPPDRYAKLITGLLKTSHVYEKTYSPDFVCDVASINNLHSLIDQRISDQNVANMVQMVPTILFDYGSSIKLSSFEDFQHCNDPAARFVSGLNLTWVYLIMFGGSNVPERQEINIYFQAPRHHRDQPRRKGKSAQGLHMRQRMHEAMKKGYLTARDPDFPRIDVRIEYTSYTWVIDIANLIGNFIENISVLGTGVSESARRNLALRAYDKVFAILRTVLFVLAGIALVVWYRFEISGTLGNVFFSEGGDIHEEIADIRRYLLLSPLLIEVIIVTPFALFVALFFWSFIILLKPYKEIESHSFILLSKSNIAYKNMFDKRGEVALKSNKIRVIENILLGISASLIAAAIWSLLYPL